VGLVLGPVDLVLLLVAPGDRVDLMGLVDPHRVDLGLVVLLLVAPGDRMDLMGLVDRAVLGLVVLLLVDRAALMARVGLRDLASRVVLVAMGPVDLADLVQTGLVQRVELTSRVDRGDRADRVVLDRAAPVDRHPRRTSNTVSTTGVARNGAAPGTRRTDSARRTTARRLHLRNAASDGTMDRPPEGHHLTGTAHRLLAAGTGRRLLAAGTADGTGRLATSLWHKPISGRSATAASIPYRSSIRFSVDGASGSSATGFRCTDLTARSPD